MKKIKTTLLLYTGYRLYNEKHSPEPSCIALCTVVLQRSLLYTKILDSFHFPPTLNTYLNTDSWTFPFNTDTVRSM